VFGISILLAFGVHEALDFFGLSVWWWVSFPSIGAFHAAIYFLVDKYGWKWPLLRGTLQIKTPDLHGEWAGFIAPASGEKVEHRSATLKIDQSWSAIKISLATGNSRSRSTMAAITDETTAHPHLQYVYSNDPKEGAVSTMHRHFGTAHLTLEEKEGERVLTGGYYTGRDRGTTGELEFRRKPENG
jgi:hypothetical protein